jgi:hypothetical protein
VAASWLHFLDVIPASVARYRQRSKPRIRHVPDGFR